MRNYLYHALTHFQPAFSRKRPYILFCALILGFLGSTEINGVSSFCRYWLVGTSDYHSFLRFFRSSAYSLDQLLLFWSSFVLAEAPLPTAQNGRAIVFGDHTFTPKDGRRMPGVVSARQQSETQTKPSYFRGHCWGAIGLCIGSFAAPFSLPLAIQLHQGFRHLGLDDEKETHKQTMGSRLVQMAVSFAYENNKPVTLLLDAFFSVATVFRQASTVWSTQLKQPFVSIIVRAKKNYVAYFPAIPPAKKKSAALPSMG